MILEISASMRLADAPPSRLAGREKGRSSGKPMFESAFMIHTGLLGCRAGEAEQKDRKSKILTNLYNLEVRLLAIAYFRIFASYRITRMLFIRSDIGSRDTLKPAPLLKL